MNIPRPEYPRPQFERASWMNLNGEWAFEIDNGRSGQARGLYKEDAQLEERILVPFCPESSLSGIGHKDFIYGVWYRREVDLTKEQLAFLKEIDCEMCQGYYFFKPSPIEDAVFRIRHSGPTKNYEDWKERRAKCDAWLNANPE